MAIYSLIAYGGTGLGYGIGTGHTFTANTSTAVNVVAQDDDAILNDWTTGSYNGTPTPGISNGDTTSTTVSSGISWLDAGDMITSGIIFTLSYTDPVSGLSGETEVALIWNDTTNGWGGTTDSYVFTTGTFIDGVTYTVTNVENNAGVPWDVLVCFTRDTPILTKTGRVAVQDLRVGSAVQTMDNGFQTVRWVGRRIVPAIGKYAPVRFRAGSLLGNDEDVVVSPNHRMLLSGSKAQLLFGEAEVLAPAKHLIRNNAVCVDAFGMVDYYHVLFDNHEIIFGGGIPSESFLPGEQALHGLGNETAQEVIDLFPELATGECSAYESARLSLKSYETALLA